MRSTRRCRVRDDCKARRRRSAVTAKCRRRRAHDAVHMQKRRPLRPVRAGGTADYARRRSGLWRDARARLLARRGKSKGCKVGKKELLRGILLDARTRARQTLRLCSYARHPCPSRRVSSRPDGARMDGVYAPKAAQCRRDTVPPDHTHRAPISMKGRRRKRQRRQQAAAAAPGERGVWRKPAPGKPPTGQGARAVFRRTLGAPARTALPCGSRAALPCGGLVDFRPNVCLQKKAGHFTNECMPIGTLRTGRAQPTGRLPGVLQNEKEKRDARGRISHTLDGEMTNVFWKTRTRGSNDQSWPADGRA